MSRREYKSGSRWAIWAWKDIYWQNELYLRRLHILQCPLFSILIHFIKQPDKQRHLHDHPVSMLCIVLKGWYVEEREWDFERIDTFNWIPATKQHQIVEVSDGGVITLCICGKREREWGFYTENGWIHWKKYHELYESSTT